MKKFLFGRCVCKVYVETLLAQFEMGLSMLLLLMGPVTRNIHSAKVMHHHLHCFCCKKTVFGKLNFFLVLQSFHDALCISEAEGKNFYNDF